MSKMIEMDVIIPHVDEELNDLTSFELAVEDGKVDKVKELLKCGKQVYRKFQRETKNDKSENILMKAVRFNHVDVFELILEEYEKDYIFAKAFVAAEKDYDKCEKSRLLRHIFIVYEDVDSAVISDMKKMVNPHPNTIVVLVLIKKMYDNDCCKVIYVNKGDLKFLIRLIGKNGLVNINVVDELTMDTAANYVCRKNRPDLLKRMIAIGLILQNKIFVESKSLIEEVIMQTSNCALLKYLLHHAIFREDDGDDLLMLTAHNPSSSMFENVMDYLVQKKFEKEPVTPTKIYCAIKDIFDSHPTFIHKIMDLSNHKLLNYILKYKFDCDQKDEMGRAAMHIAVQDENCFEFVREILKRGFRIKKHFDTHESLLDAINGDTSKEMLEEIMKYMPRNYFFSVKSPKFIELIIYGIRLHVKSLMEYIPEIDVNAIYDEDGNTALLLAVKHSCDCLFKKLLAQNGNIYSKNVHNETVLILACRYATKEMIDSIYKRDPKFVNVVNNSRRSPLTEIIIRGAGYEDIFEELVVHNADIALIDSKSNSLLHVAVAVENIHYVQRLLDYGVDPQLQDENGNTALHLSVKGENIEMFKAILASEKVNLGTKNYDGNTILHEVCRVEDPRFCRELFKSGRKSDMILNSKNEGGQTALHYCYDNERFRLLLEKGADIKILDDTKTSAYISAALDWNIDILMTVFQMNIDLTIPNKDGMTLLYCITDKKIPLKEGIDKYERVKEMFRKCSNTVEAFTLETPVFRAAATNFEYLEYMFAFSAIPIDLEMRNHIDRTAIFGAVE